MIAPVLYLTGESQKMGFTNTILFCVSKGRIYLCVVKVYKS